MADYEAMTDEELICSLRGGDAKITDFIMDKYKFLVKKKAKAMYILGGDNDDLIQEGMIGLFKAVRDFEEGQGMTFYSFADLCISRQMYSAIEASRRKKHIPLNSYVSLYEEHDESEESKKPPLIDILESEQYRDPEEMYFHKEFVVSIEKRLRESLSSLESRVLYLHLKGTDYQTIARLLDKSPKTIDNALQRIKAKAEKIISDEKQRDKV